jgi:hypothetical protein
VPTDATLPWAEAIRSRRFKLLTIGTVAGLTAALLSLNAFLRFNESRAGATLVDPVLALLPAADFSMPLFALIYGTLVLSVLNLWRQPRALLVALQAYTLLITFRMGMMYCVPLEPPPGTIELVDPVVLALGDGSSLTKDLFFSGHTSTTFLFALCVRSGLVRLLCFGASATVAVMVLLQHTHYTVDVLVAPFVAFTSQQLARGISARVLDAVRGQR